MNRIVTAITAASFVILIASCCCTGQSRAPKLRKSPKFQEIQTTTVEEEVIPTK